MSEYILKAQTRQGTGRSAINKIKKQGLVPAIYYHRGDQSIPLAIKYSDIMAMMRTPHSIINLRLDNNKTLMAVAKDIQYSPVEGRPIHISFEGIKMNETFHTYVPLKVVYDNEKAPWLKEGGVLQTLAHEVQIECLPKDMPNYIEINVSDLQIGEAFMIKDLKRPNIKFLEDPHHVLASIILPKKEAEPEVVTEVLPVDGAAPEATAAAGTTTPPNKGAPAGAPQKNDQQNQSGQKQKLAS